MTEQALTWLSAHPGSSAHEIAAGIGRPQDHRLVYDLLKGAERDGLVQRGKEDGNSAWLWEARPGAPAAAAEEALARVMYDAGTAEVERLYPGTGGMTPVSWEEVKAAWPASLAMWLAAARAALQQHAAAVASLQAERDELARELHAVRSATEARG